MLRRLSWCLVTVLVASCVVAAMGQGGVVRDSYTGHYSLPGGRTFYLHAPVGGGPAVMPLVVALPGAGQTAAQMQAYTGLTAYADGRFAVAYGVGLYNSWDAGTCCGWASDHDTGDLAYLRQVVAAAARVTLIDLARVYVVGFSNGGMMAYRAVCEAPEVFAAAGVVAGALLVDCPVAAAVLHVHGTADATVPLAGGVGFRQVRFPPARTEPARMAPGARWLLSTHAGEHIWPAAATRQLWAFLRHARPSFLRLRQTDIFDCQGHRRS